ncbi:MAG: preprotein translocase subunit SecE [Sinobacteraceae bacterium]|nr:preprotein translocase subunit SecE [Nevskiaceae bacterium]
MDSQRQEAASKFDTSLLTIAVFLIVGGIFAYYYLDATLAIGPRLGVLVGAVAVALLLGYQTELGKGVWTTILGSRVEVRKVVWPSRQQSIQLTLMVALVVLLTALFMWLADSILLRAAQFITGAGS